MSYRLEIGKANWTILMLPLIWHMFDGGWRILLITLLILIQTLYYQIQFKREIMKVEIRIDLIFIRPCIYRKTIHSKQIKLIKLKRKGWMRKAATIHIRRGINLQIDQSIPDDVLPQLIIYANTNEVPLVKTKDYLILER